MSIFLSEIIKKLPNMRKFRLEAEFRWLTFPFATQTHVEIVKCDVDAVTASKEDVELQIRAEMNWIGLIEGFKAGVRLTVKRTKYFWFDSPTQLFTHGQWWSIFRMQRLQMLRREIKLRLVWKGVEGIHFRNFILFSLERMWQVSDVSSCDHQSGWLEVQASVWCAFLWLSACFEV